MRTFMRKEIAVTRKMLWLLMLVAVGAPASTSAHITPVVVLRKQADVIRQTLPGAVNFDVSTVKLSKTALQKIQSRAHYTPDAADVRFYSGKDAKGAVVGMVVFPQVDTMHGPLEVGVTISPSGALVSAMVTRATVETKSWVVEVERSGALEKLKGETASDPPRTISGDGLSGMPGYIADSIATAAFRGLVLRSVLLP